MTDTGSRPFDDGGALQTSLFSPEEIAACEASGPVGRLRPGQWRLSKVQVVNWGTFHGLHTLEVSREGLLITGSSGSGKSSLLDAITAVLTPPRALRFNAAAQGGATAGEDRSLVSYIRGAWRHETDETGEIANSYLRGKGATWSGVLLRYDNGSDLVAGGHGGSTRAGVPAASASDALGVSADSAARTARTARPVYLVALFHLKAGSAAKGDVARVYAIARGECDLREFEPYVRSGIDAARIRKKVESVDEVFKDHRAFSARFRRLLGIRSERTLELLHKTQAAKNFDSLDRLFRRFMLDEPKTFAQAAEAVDQFQSLSRAYNDVVDQRRQRDCLKPLPDLSREFDAAQKAVEEAEELGSALDFYTERTAMDFLRDRKRSLAADADEAGQRVCAVQAEVDDASRAVDNAQTLLNESGGIALSTAEMSMFEREKTLQQVRKLRVHLLKELACAGVTALPDTASEFGALRRAVADQAAEARAGQEAGADEEYRIYSRVTELKDEAAKLRRELIYLRKHASNIPEKYDAVRVSIARHLGLSRDELPFIGELVTVEPEWLEWQGAIERLLGRRAVTLLVPARRAAQVAAFVDGRHLGLRFEFEAVPEQVEVVQRNLGELSLVRRVRVTPCRSHAEFSLFVNRMLREQFDFACVDTPAELAKHRFALTRAGQIKRGGTFVKDDRHKIDDRSRWVLGGTNDAKIEEYERRAARVAEELAAAEKRVSEAKRLMLRARDLEHAARALEDADWREYDAVGAAEELEKARAFYEGLRTGNDEFDAAARLLEAARERSDRARAELVKAQTALALLNGEIEQVELGLAKRSERLAGLAPCTAEQADALGGLFKKRNRRFRASVEDILQTRTDVQKQLDARGREARELRQRARTQAERIMHEFGQVWAARCLDLTDDYSDLDGYLGILRQIEQSGLPDYENRFLHVLHDFSQDQITVMASTIRSAYREVRDKLEPVNRSLALSEYDAGIHLRIEARNIRPREAEEFLGVLGEIAAGTWNDEDVGRAETRYRTVAGIIERLKSPSYADERWRRLCLDTREHVGFVAKEVDEAGTVCNIHSSDAGLSGGQKQKLVVFCLAAALRYQLADEDEPVPSYGTVILDEAFDKADHRFTVTAMNIFEVFGFHMVLATPLKLLTTLEGHVGAIACAHCRDSRYSSLTLIPFEAAEAGGEDAAGAAGGEGEDAVAGGGGAGGEGAEGAAAAGGGDGTAAAGLPDPASKGA